MLVIKFLVSPGVLNFFLGGGGGEGMGEERILNHMGRVQEVSPSWFFCKGSSFRNYKNTTELAWYIRDRTDPAFTKYPPPPPPTHTHSSAHKLYIYIYILFAYYNRWKGQMVHG